MYDVESRKEGFRTNHMHTMAVDVWQLVTPPRPDLRPPGQGSKWWITAHTVEGGHRRLGWLDLPKAPEYYPGHGLGYLDEVRS